MRYSKLPACTLVLCFFILTAGCSKSPELVRVIESEIIDSLLAAAPVSLIDIDVPEVDSLYPDMELGQPQDSLADGTAAVVGTVFGLVVARDSLYIADFDETTIFVSSLDGVIRRRVGRHGGGPGEFHQLVNLTHNGSSFFTHDGNRIQELSPNLAHVGSATVSNLTTNIGTLVSNASRLYFTCGRGAKFRICPVSTEAPYELLQPFVPSLPIEQPPLNSFTVGASVESGLVYGAFNGLPYVFVFDESHRHVHTIRFYGKQVAEHAGNYEIRDVPAGAGVSTTQPLVGLRQFIGNLFVLKDGVIVARILQRWHFLHRQEDGSYKLEHTIRFKFVAPGETKERHVFATWDIKFYQGHLYLADPWHPHVLRYPFPQ